MAQIVIDFKPSLKQKEMFDAFNDNITTEVVFGGAILTGKSYAAASLLVMKCLQHEGIRVGVARNSITNLKKTTVITIIKLLDDWGLVQDEHYQYNSQAGMIKFYNGSEIILSELQFLPSDPNFTRLGGLELTFGVVDEAGEVDDVGKRVYQSRLGRWRNDKYNIKPFLLMTANPSKNFLYRDFYLPYKQGTLKPYQKFIPVLPSDNPYIPKGYIENLQNTLSLTERQRLLQGNWELTDDESALFKHSDIQLTYDTSIMLSQDKTMRLSADIAFTNDSCVFIIWSGLNIIDIIKFDKLKDTTIVDKIKEICTQYNIKTNNISYDADGVGLYIKQHFPSAVEIHNNGKTIKTHGYINLKTELYFKLKEVIETGKLKFSTQLFRKEIEEELSVIKHKPRESLTNKIELISKAEMKRFLGRSPDYADALCYGMIHHVKSNVMTANDFIFINI
jgi:phage terminase large subunit